MVEFGSTDPSNGLPRAVGLLFAGSSSSAIANPIDLVLGAFGATMVGGAAVEPGPTGTIMGAVLAASAGTPVEGATVSADSGQSGVSGVDGL